MENCRTKDIKAKKKDDKLIKNDSDSNQIVEMKSNNQRGKPCHSI